MTSRTIFSAWCNLQRHGKMPTGLTYAQKGVNFLASLPVRSLHLPQFIGLTSLDPAATPRHVTDAWEVVESNQLWRERSVKR